MERPCLRRLRVSIYGLVDGGKEDDERDILGWSKATVEGNGLGEE